MPEIERIAVSELGRRPDGTNWLEFEIDSHTNSPVVLFHYPSTLQPGFEYLRRSVKLELGSLTDQQPTGRHGIIPWIAEVLPEAFADWRCVVTALESERSFWEKATILHVEYHRPSDRPTPDRHSRHYADTAAMARLPIGESALGRPDLRERVVAWKSRFFGTAWARYDLARPDTFKLVPPDSRVAALRNDFDAMRPMYLSEPPRFDQIMETLAQLERRINGEAAT